MIGRAYLYVLSAGAFALVVSACSGAPEQCPQGDPSCGAGPTHDGGATTSPDGGTQSSPDSGSTSPDSGQITGGDGGGNHEGGHVPDGGLPDSGGVDAGAGTLDFGAVCSANSECKSDLCFSFNAKGNHCTQPCQSANDCPGGAGGLGCSGMHVCKVP